jgi:hypothetical protein
MTRPTCGTCQFWTGIPTPRFIVKAPCRRYPPGSSGDWPETRAIDWCGEHQPQPKDQTND